MIGLLQEVILFLRKKTRLTIPFIYATMWDMNHCTFSHMSMSEEYYLFMGETNMKTLLSISLSLIVLVVFIFTPVAAENVPKMTKEELEGILDHSDVVVIDVRYTESWQESDVKIKGATRGNPTDFRSWAEQFQKEKTLVLY